MVEPLPTPTTLVPGPTCLSTAVTPASCLAASTDMAALLATKLVLVEKLQVAAVRALVARRLAPPSAQGERRLPPVTSPWIATSPTPHDSPWRAGLAGGLATGGLATRGLADGLAGGLATKRPGWRPGD